MIEDVLGWVAVLIVGLVSIFVDLPILDPILSILIATHILVNVIGRLRESARLILQAAPKGMNLENIRRNLHEICGVVSLHHTHLWSLDGEHNVFTTHLVVDNNTPNDEVVRIRHRALEMVDELDLEHVTIAVEYEHENCALR